MAFQCPPNVLPPSSGPAINQLPVLQYAYANKDDMLVQNDTVVQNAPGFSFADVMAVMGIDNNDMLSGINRTFQFATAWGRSERNDDVSKAGILWKVNKHRESPTQFKPTVQDFDTYFVGFVSPVKGGGYKHGTFAASDFTWQLTPTGVPVLMAATPYTAHVGFVNVFHYSTKYAVYNYATNSTFGYPNAEFKGTRIVGLDIIAQDSEAENAQVEGVVGQFGLAKTAAGNVFLMYTDQGKNPTGQNEPITPAFPVGDKGNQKYSVAVMKGEPIETTQVAKEDTGSLDESAQLYPSDSVNTLSRTKNDGMPSIVVDPSLENNYLRWQWSSPITIVEKNLSDYTITYTVTMQSSPNAAPGDYLINKPYTIPPNGENTCFQMLMPTMTFTLSDGTSSPALTATVPLRNYLQAGIYPALPLSNVTGPNPICLNVLVRNTKKLGSNVYYYTDVSQIPPVSSDEVVYNELTVQPPPARNNTVEIVILSAVVAVFIVVVAVLIWWFRKGRKAKAARAATAAGIKVSPKT